MSAYDNLILGSSPNALVAAARLARAGQRTLVLETRSSVGGPVATETFAPGFKADTGVASAPLDAEIGRDLGVHVETIRRETVTLLATGATLTAPPAFPPAVAPAVELLRALYRTSPPSLPRPDALDSESLSALASKLLGFGARPMHEVLRLLFMSVRDFANEQAWSEPERAMVAGVALRGAADGPFAQGTLFGLLHHLATDDGGARLTAAGGVQQVAQALADRARALGADVRTGVPGPCKIDVVDGTARGVLLGNGDRVEAKRVLSDHDARATFTRLVSPAALEPEFNREIRNLRYQGTVARVHLALKGLPRIANADPQALSGTLVLAPSVNDLERAWDQAKRGVPSSHPYMELTVPTVADPSMAPEGHHVLSAWVQHVPYRKGEHAAVLAAVRALVDAEVLAHHVALPDDLEARFGVTEGHLYGGPVRLESAFFLRPTDTPVENLHLCGSGAHPGGYSGLSGWTLAGRFI